ncbi:MAG: nucleotidyl transferase AbiEii/AbiGii toxin family protein, partial [Bacteroidetes bacterium]|nr:nucleotidyl transferase AbiEii/AbiGii toxin family protein [Bacteroidota bacterium]
MPKGITNLPASVHQKLLNKATETSRLFNELLQYFAMERFIYRLSKTDHASKFVLKGALMFSVWGSPASRPTKDIDLLGKTSNDIRAIEKIMRDACRIKVEPDGMTFD